MSADVYLMPPESPGSTACPHCDGTGRISDVQDEIAHINLSYGLNPMLHNAGWTWGIAADAATAADLVAPLQAAIERLEAAPEVFRSMDPENGWGSYDRALPRLRKFLASCRANPTARVRTYL